MTYTLAQFERIDGLFNACLRRPDLEQVMEHPLASQDYIRAVYFRPEWQLTDALIELLGIDCVNEFASAIDCAADFLTRCLSSATLVEAE